MDKRIGLILAGAVVFDLGLVVPSSHAAYDAFLKLDAAAPHGALKIKLDKVDDAEVCKSHGGKVTTEGGDQFCKIPASRPVTHSGY
jgi:hypothetical protein